MRTGNLKVRAITDEVLADDVRKALLAQRGVRTATVRVGEPGGAEVQYDEQTTSLEQLVGRLRDQGFDAEVGGYSAGGAP